MSINRIAFYHLETLLWIARLGTFAAAAARLNTTQPAISARVRELESHLGTALFRREGRTMALTPAGRELVRESRIVSLRIIGDDRPGLLANVSAIIGQMGANIIEVAHNRLALVALSGEVCVYLNDGVVSETVSLTAPNQCLLVEPKDWHSMTFGAGSILLVMASHPYDRSDYIDTPYETPP
jgi:hypothetical protein